MRKIKNEYLEWLYDLVCDDTYSNHVLYHKLFNTLLNRKFIWFIPRDENRAIDGLELRDTFQNLYPEIPCMPNASGCSVLEVLIALAKRCENSIASDDEFGDRTGQWFWEMIVNMGLGKYDDGQYDDEEVNYIIDLFLNRNYDDHSLIGCAFNVQYPKAPMNQTELWYQMCWHLSEVL